MTITRTDPTIRADEAGRIIKQHPSFGNVTLSVTQTNGTYLHGSDLNHQSYMYFVVSLGEEQRESESDIHYSKAHGTGKSPVLVEFSMSMSQYVSLITTPNTGSGVPCTLNRYRTNDMVSPPMATRPEPFHERLANDVDKAAAKEVEKLNATLRFVEELAEKGKAGKKEINELHRMLSGQICNLPDNLAFSVTLAKEAVDKTVDRGKTELEAAMVNTMIRIGLDKAQQCEDLSVMALPSINLITK
ncbi:MULTISPECIES: hypothetical protein [unclassified Providencia]|uniref:hypothetical protein n=1 Tax=unclassified Providencia TaxID=2633465 RepID=UPI00109CB234|nr:MULTISPECIES: hypothetical protein [unclassified Providencia]THB27335.1 hypothetical protein E6R27_08820 [Providencia sp. MGF014]